MKPNFLSLHLTLLFLLVLSACQTPATIQTPAPLEITPTVPSPAPISTDTPQPVKVTVPVSTRNPTIVPSSPAPAASATPGVEPVTTLLFTGVIVPARCVQAALDANGNPDYPYEEVSQIISQADLAVGTFNATMSDKVEHTGCMDTYQLVGSPDNAGALERAGFDVMSVATNHIKDCGLMKGWCNSTFFDTLEHLRRAGIQTTGAGKDLAEALKPVIVNQNGVRFGFISLGDSKMDEIVFASADNPGIARLNEENLKAAVDAVRPLVDVLIVLPHWGSEDNAVPNWIQRDQARQIVEAGADLVVGNHTHVVQSIQELDGVPVFYGLGNFVFDQDWGHHRQAVILLVKFQGQQYIGYELIPTHVDRDGRVHLAGEAEAQEILQRIEQSSQALP
jgi:poly-gamma-glutamate capsule biosynthesis protein CapA/YwtB (metallophosphatase superfamily)